MPGYCGPGQPLRRKFNMKTNIRQTARCLCSAAVLAALTACGGGDSGPPTYTVGGTVTGLAGSGLVLQNEANGDVLAISAPGAFTFATRMLSGTSYSVTVKTPPTSQGCGVANGAGTIAATDVTNVTVSCRSGHRGYYGVSGLMQFSYVANAVDSTVSAYTVDATSGALAAVGAPVETGTSPHAIVGTQDRRFLFVGNEGSNDISAFAVNSASGALVAVPGSPFAAGADPKALALLGTYPLGPYLYVANAGSDTVSAFAVDSSTGSLTPLSPATFATGKGPSSIEVDPTGRFLYVANNGGSNDISVFSVDLSTGLLTPVAGSPFPAGASPLSLALGATGQFLYTANPDATNSSISGFSVDLGSGVLTPLSGSPFPLAVSHSIATDRTGAYLYVTSGANVLGYGIDPTSGALTALAGFPVGTGAGAYSVTIDPTNQFLYVVNRGSANVSGFGFDASTGGLTPITDSPFATGNLPGIIAAL